MLEALQFEFIQNALIAGLLTSIACGIIGTLVVVNRLVFIAGGITHASYGGIGLALFFRFNATIGAAVFALFTSFIMGIITIKNKHRSDTIIGAIWAVGMAIGILLLDFTPGYTVDLMSYLFGSILTVSTFDLIVMGILSFVMVIIIGMYYRQFLALSYDEEFSKVLGIPVTVLYLTLLALIAFSVVMMIQVVGLILVIALLTIPPYIAEKHSRSLGLMMIYSFILSTAFTVTGLWLSYNYNLTSGATIIMVAAVFFFIHETVHHIKTRYFSNHK